MSVIIPRSAWAPRYRDGSAVIGLSAWRDIFVHHTVTRSGADELAHMRYLEQIGQDSFGQGISYTVIVFPSGNAYQGHSMDTRGAHTYQRNDSARAICFVGNFDEDRPTQAALDKAVTILREWRGKGWPSRITGGHRDVYPTACPGVNLYALLDSLNRESDRVPIQPQEAIGDDAMLIKKLTGKTGVGTVALVSGGLVSAVDRQWAEETNSKAGGSLMIGVSEAVWDDLVAKSTAQESVPGLLRDILTELRKDNPSE